MSTNRLPLAVFLLLSVAGCGVEGEPYVFPACQPYGLHCTNGATCCSGLTCYHGATGSQCGCFPQGLPCNPGPGAGCCPQYDCRANASGVGFSCQ